MMATAASSSPLRGVLVTGATTPFGRALITDLLSRSEVEAVLAVALEREWTGPRDPRIRYLPCDLTRSRNLRDLLFGPARDLGITSVVHSAHHRSVRAHGRRVHALNVETTREILQLAERHPTIRRFVYLGSAEIYRIEPELPALIGEDHPIEMSPEMPQRLRDRVEADMTVCTRMGLSPLSIAVLRVAEIFAPYSGSQLHDYVASNVCYRPLGYDPMLDVISIADAVRATVRALGVTAQGVFNIPGADVLPLSAAIEAAGRIGIPVPGPIIRPLYAARALLRDTEFTWPLNRWRFRWSGVLDGTRAATTLSYTPQTPTWPRDTHRPSKPLDLQQFSSPPANPP
ncbi:MAG: NAD-dependent epimerase/dehydratase family protein [Myxococcota bacterium]|nr:NAD-dependent epimerase/dehydratase family protein [Myxococcota bacterium]